MTVNQHADRFFGPRVVDFRHGDKLGLRGTDAVYRLVQRWEAEESQRELLAEFLAQVDPGALEALVIGRWSDSQSDAPQEYLSALAELRLPRLRALFVGDIVSEECEISWIQQGDYTVLIGAYPGLEVLRIRGGTGLSLPRTEYRSLRELAVETGGLPSSVMEEITQSTFPQLKRLELWLGDDGYGFDGDMSTCAALLESIRPGRLSYLGLRDFHRADELAEHLAGQEWLGRLHTLDLSMGTIGDRGAQALCASPHIQGLSVLDLRHHYISRPVIEALERLPLTLLIDERHRAGDRDDDRYVQVGE
jgi:hypothetical protein